MPGYLPMMKIAIKIEKISNNMFDSRKIINALV